MEDGDVECLAGEAWDAPWGMGVRYHTKITSRASLCLHSRTVPKENAPEQKINHMLMIPTNDGVPNLSCIFFPPHLQGGGCSPKKNRCYIMSFKE